MAIYLQITVNALWLVAFPVMAVIANSPLQQGLVVFFITSGVMGNIAVRAMLYAKAVKAVYETAYAEAVDAHSESIKAVAKAEKAKALSLKAVRNANLHGDVLAIMQAVHNGEVLAFTNKGSVLEITTANKQYRVTRTSLSATDAVTTTLTGYKASHKPANWGSSYPPPVLTEEELEKQMQEEVAKSRMNRLI